MQITTLSGNINNVVSTVLLVISYKEICTIIPEGFQQQTNTTTAIRAYELVSHYNANNLVSRL